MLAVRAAAGRASARAGDHDAAAHSAAEAADGRPADGGDAHAARWTTARIWRRASSTRCMERYGGTRLGRQELDGELIEDDPDALFRRELIEHRRVREVPELRRIVVAVDPPASHAKRANACGIVCAGLGERRPGLCAGRCLAARRKARRNGRPLRWRSITRARPTGWWPRSTRAAPWWRRCCARSTRRWPSVRSMRARGKRTRAEPVAALYEQGRVSHVGRIPGAGGRDVRRGIGEAAAAPDRLDALVWAVSELMLRPAARAAGAGAVRR